jgi:hypothetical protein
VAPDTFRVFEGLLIQLCSRAGYVELNRIKPALAMPVAQNFCPLSGRVNVAWFSFAKPGMQYLKLFIHDLDSFLVKIVAPDTFGLS